MLRRVLFVCGALLASTAVAHAVTTHPSVRGFYVKAGTSCDNIFGWTIAPTGWTEGETLICKLTYKSVEQSADVGRMVRYDSDGGCSDDNRPGYENQNGSLGLWLKNGKIVKINGFRVKRISKD